MTLFCEGCGELIDPAKIAKRSRSNPPRFCSHECAQTWLAEHNRSTDFFARLSQAGNAAQQRVKVETGKRSGYDQRATHARAINAKRGKQRKIQ